MRSLIIALSAVVLTAAVPAPAQAQGYISPYIGYDFGGDAGSCSVPSLLNSCETKKTNFGVTAGSLIAGIFGFEEDLGYAPSFFGKTSGNDTSLLTLMSNVIVSAPLPWARPYASGGIGLIRSHVGFNTASLANFDDNSFGYDIGGGVMALLPHHLGVKGDFRYIRSVKNITISGVSLNNPQLNFSRISVGLVVH